jgi:hypothetical protein
LPWDQNPWTIWKVFFLITVENCDYAETRPESPQRAAIPGTRPTGFGKVREEDKEESHGGTESTEEKRKGKREKRKN